MAIGILHGHTDAPRDDRALWLAAALGASEGTAIGLTGLAARAGVRGSARLMRRVPTTSVGPNAGRAARIGSRLSSKSGPWSLPALLPYALGASVGAAGNLALAISVGRAANKYFKSTGVSDESAASGGSGRGSDSSDSSEDELLDAEFLSERFLDDD